MTAGLAQSAVTNERANSQMDAVCAPLVPCARAEPTCPNSRCVLAIQTCPTITATPEATHPACAGSLTLAPRRAVLVAPRANQWPPALQAATSVHVHTCALQEAYKARMVL